MFKFGSWNVWGLNDPSRQVECKNFIVSNKVSLMVIIETNVKYASNSRIIKKIRDVWGWTHNYDAAYNGRLWVGWDKSLISVQILHVDEQMIHMKITTLSDSFACICTAIYAYNAPMQREPLWDRLRNFEIQLPWILLGDYNIVLCQEEHIQGGLLTRKLCTTQ